MEPPLPPAMLPPDILRTIARKLLANEGPANRVLLILQFCGACSRWREVGRELVDAELSFSDAAQQGKWMSPRWRKADAGHKRAALLGAAGLLSGYAELTVSGAPVTDEVLQRVAATNAGRLTSLKVVGARNITDAGLCAAIRASPQLRQFVLEDAGQGVTGAFVPALLQHCRQLESLAIEGAERISWALLRQPGTWAAEAAAGLPPQPQQQGASTSASCSTLSRAVRAAQSARTAAHAAAGAGGTSSAARALLQLQQDQHQQQDQGEANGELYRHSRRLSSSSSISGGVEPAESDSGGSSSSLGAASDSTSISVPAAAVSELTLQLRDASLSGEAGVPSSSSSPWHQAAAAGQPAVEAQARARHLAAAGSPPSSSSSSAGVLGRRPHSALRRLRVRFTTSEGLAQLLAFAPAATELSLDGPAAVVRAAVALCPSLRRLTYLVSSPAELDAALLCLAGARSLEALELEVKAMVLSPAQLGAIGMLPLQELCLDSHAFRQHPSMPRPQYSHLDNDGVKALVDAVCTRMRTELMPLKLSLCGATALRQEAVSALLRLPILASIDTGGCVKLTPMDRMRLVAKVKAGQGCLLDARGSAGSSGLVGLRQLAHVL